MTWTCRLYRNGRLEDDRLDIAAAFDSAFVRSAGGAGQAARLILEETGWPPVEGLAMVAYTVKLLAVQPLQLNASWTRPVDVAAGRPEVMCVKVEPPSVER